MNITIVSAHKVAILPRIRSPDMEICSRYDHKKNTVWNYFNLYNTRNNFT